MGPQPLSPTNGAYIRMCWPYMQLNIIRIAAATFLYNVIHRETNQHGQHKRTQTASIVHNPSSTRNKIQRGNGNNQLQKQRFII